jgi:hypothetical protein
MRNIPSEIDAGDRFIHVARSGPKDDELGGTSAGLERQFETSFSILGKGCTWLSHAVGELLRRAREQRELAGLDEAQLRELRHMARRAGTAL